MRRAASTAGPEDFAQPGANGISLLVRPKTENALSGVRQAIVSIDRKLTLFDVETLGGYLQLSRYAMRITMRTYGGIALSALLPSVVGLACVTAYAVAQRRKEIGIRMAAKRNLMLGREEKQVRQQCAGFKVN